MDVATRYALGHCSLGVLLIARGPHGLRAILIGDDEASLLQSLHRRLPDAGPAGHDPAFGQTVAEVAAFIDRPGTTLDLPLDPQGTPFQQRVWRALRAIPAGTTVSYRELAERIGAPGAARAVARACADNPLAIVIPCHRVIRSDGSLSGYRWGIHRKRQLLEREVA